MVSVVVEKDIPQPAAKVWALLADFGDISWSGMDNVEVEGEGVGMIRRIIVGEGAAVERLEAYDSEAMSFTYAIVSGNPLPIDNLKGSPKVTAVDDSNCRLSWTVTGAEAGISEQEAGDMLSGFYSGLLETVSNAVLAKE
jgi:hypothetical protein